MDFWNRSWFEKWLPIASSVAIIAIGHFFRTDVSTKFCEGGWSETNLFTAVFDWSAIQSGFMFAIYGFVATKRDGFSETIHDGDSFQKFISFTKRACAGGFLLTILSLPLLVISPKIGEASNTTYYLVLLWFAFFIWAFIAFLRVAFSFGIIVATKDRPKKTPG